MPCIESKEADKYHKLSDATWKLCEGTEDLTFAECTKLLSKWKDDDWKDSPWLKTIYRIMPEPTSLSYYLYYMLPNRRLVNVNDERGAHVSSLDEPEAQRLASYWSCNGPAYPVTIDTNHALHNTRDGEKVKV